MRQRSFTATETLGRGLDVWVRSLPLASLLAVLIVAPLYTLFHFVSADTFGLGFSLQIVAMLFAQMVINGLVARVVFDRLDEVDIDLSQASATVLRRIGAIVPAAAVVALLAGACVVAAGLVSDAFATSPSNKQISFSILAGVVGCGVAAPFYLATCLAPAVAANEKGSFWRALREAARLSKGERMTLLSLHMLTLFVQVGIALVVLMPLRAVEDASPSMLEPSTFVASMLALLLVQTAMGSVAATAYHDLKLRQEGFGISALKRIFE